MTYLINTIIFKQAQLEPTPANFQLGMQVAAWLNYTCASATRNMKTGEYIAPVVSLPPQYRVGKTYHRWLKLGVLEHTQGFDFANHFIKLTAAWLEATHNTITDRIDDEGNSLPDIVMTNGVVHNVRYINETHCLVKLTDENYTELKDLITFDSEFNPTNIVAEDKYFAAIAEGGEFYVEPQNNEE